MFGHPYCSSINSTEFNVEHENICPFHCHIGSSINNISGDVLTCNCAKKKLFYNFLYKIHDIYKKFKSFKRTAIKISFLFFFFTISKQRNSLEKF